MFIIMCLVGVDVQVVFFVVEATSYRRPCFAFLCLAGNGVASHTFFPELCRFSTTSGGGGRGVKHDSGAFAEG